MDDLDDFCIYDLSIIGENFAETEVLGTDSGLIYMEVGDGFVFI